MLYVVYLFYFLWLLKVLFKHLYWSIWYINFNIPFLSYQKFCLFLNLTLSCLDHISLGTVSKSQNEVLVTH